MARNTAIDAMRGLCIVLVVVGHTKGVPPQLHKFIYSFHMPAFFFLSGYLFNPQRFESGELSVVVSYVKDRFWRLVMPAWLIGLICGIPYVAMLLLGKTPLHEFLEKLVGTVIGYPSVESNFNCTPIWFLFCLFLMELTAASIALGSRRFFKPILFVIGLSGIFISTLPFYYIPFNLNVVPLGLLFFSVGCFARSSRFFSLEQPHMLLGVVAAIIWLAGVSLAPDEINTSIGFLGHDLSGAALNAALALMGTYMVYCLADRLQTSFSLKWLGVHTLPILGFNCYANSLVFKVFREMHIDYWPLVFLVQLVLLVVICRAFDRSGVLGDLINGRGLARLKKTGI